MFDHVAYIYAWSNSKNDVWGKTKFASVGGMGWQIRGRMFELITPCNWEATEGGNGQLPSRHLHPDEAVEYSLMSHQQSH